MLRKTVIGGIAAIVLASPNVVAQTSSSVQQPRPPITEAQQKNYKIVVEIENDEFNLLNSLNDQHGNIRFEKGSLTYGGTRDYIRETTQKILQFRGMPDIGIPKKALESLAAELNQNPEYLSSSPRFEFRRARPEPDGKIYQLSYGLSASQAGRDINNLLFRGYMRGDGTIEVIQLTRFAYESLSDSYQGGIIGAAGYEMWHGGPNIAFPNNKVLTIRPYINNDQITLNEIDPSDLRAKLFDGLRKQNLRFTPDWKPVTK